MRILLISQYFPPEIGATQSRMESFAQGLADRGHEVTVIAEFPNHPHGVIPPEYRGRLVDDDRSGDYRVLRVWVKAASEKTQKTRLAFYTSFMAMATAVSLGTGPADVVLATSPPLFVGLAGLAVARLKRAPLVLDVRDLWPAAAVSLNQISSGRPLQIAEAIERLLYRQADVVTAVTQPFCRHIDAIRRRPPSAVFLPNGTLERFFEPVAPAPRASLGVPDDRFTVTFAGMLGIAQALPTVLDAAALVGDSATFALLGEGPMKEMLVADAHERALTNVEFVPQVPIDEVAPYLVASDALLVTLSAHPTFTDFIPSKMIDFMAVGRPVILSAAGESARLLEQAEAGIVVPPEDPEALADAVRWLAAHPEDAERMGQRGRAFARGRLRSTQVARLEQILVAAASGRRRRQPSAAAPHRPR